MAEISTKGSFLDYLSEKALFQFSQGGDEAEGMSDPLQEVLHSPVDGLIRRYDDRVVLLATRQCFYNCSFCNRRELLLKKKGELKVNIGSALSYIKRNKQIREVIISGGDPFTLKNEQLESLLSAIRAIGSVEVIRIGTRAPLFCPSRIDEATVRMIAKFNPVYLCVHFNHPSELFEESVAACRLPGRYLTGVLNQSVLLKGVNDDAETLCSLFWELTKNGIRPYYIFQCERVRGTSRFWVSLDRAIGIMRRLRMSLPGHAIPHFAVDLPGLEGKCWIDPFNPPWKVDGGFLIEGFFSKQFYREVDETLDG